MARLVLALSAIVVASVLALTLILMTGNPPATDLNGTIIVANRGLTIPERIGHPELEILLIGDDFKRISGAQGYVELTGRKFAVQEADGTYLARLENVSAGTYDAKIVLSREEYLIPELDLSVKVRFERLIEGDEIRLEFSRLPFQTDRPQVCRPQVLGEGLNVTVLYDGSRNPIVRFEIALPQPLDLSSFHYALVNITFHNCPDLSIGLVDGGGSSVWHAMDIPNESLFHWEFDYHHERLVRTSWDGLWGGLVPRHLEADWIDLGNISKVLFRTTQTMDGTDQWMTIHEISFIREPVLVSICPPALRDAINQTLAIRADPLFIDDVTGLPYEFINLRDMVVPASSDLDFTIGNNEIGEGLTSFWMYYFGSGEDWVGDFLHDVARNMAKYLDPGSGLIGLHHYDRRTGQLEEDTHRLGGCDFRGGPAGESSAQHGGEDPMYMMLPAAWYFGEQEAVAALERFSRTMLCLNSDPRLVHLHLYVKRCDGEWSVGDWDGEHGEDINIVGPDPNAYTDLSEFWWVTPMLGTAMVTRDASLKAAIIDRCRTVMENVIRHQDASGRIPYVFRMDGELARFEKTALGWLGYNLDSVFVRSAYLMHNLTGDAKYLEALERLFDYFLDGRVPSLYSFASHILFHAYYTGDSSRVDSLIRHTRTSYPLSSIQGDIYGCTWRLFPWVWNGSEPDLQMALEGESRFRSCNWVPIPYESDLHHYYPLSTADTIIEWGWCPLDKFGSGVEEFFALSVLGSRTKGLVGRDLLILGMLADIPRHGIDRTA